MLAAVGGLVAARSTLTPDAPSALSTSALAAPPTPSTRPEHPHTPAAPASPRSLPTRQVRQTPAPEPKPPARREVTGRPYDVGYGVVQVRITLVGSHLRDVTALSLPQGGRSSDISSYAAPRLRQEALAAQSARIDTVSGASYTSAGYARSLQSALDASRS
jgi:uncharacterized protein with FMN-binding domain